MLQYPKILLNSFEHRNGFSEYKSGEDKLYILQRKLTTPVSQWYFNGKRERKNEI